ncbi:MAG: hypothetical protein IJN67_13335 [Oscillospiraceae bacterium]|nr:hypothetical protein [Oscillospiraceae bacterium]
MEVFLAFIGLMDDTIMAMLGVPVLAVFLVGSLAAVGVGVFLMAADLARGRRV